MPAMHNDDTMHELLRTVRLALGRTSPLTSPPTPPQIDQTITRLVHTEIALPELFARTAQANKMGVQTVSPEQLAPKLVDFAKSRNVKTIALAGSKLLKDLCVMESLRQAGMEARSWDQLTLEELYDMDCGITDVWAAVAEVGALVIRGSPEHARALSLVPPIHIAVVEPRNLMPDLVDLFQRLPTTPNEKFVLITGPSKTADIEMNLVTGVHGPGVVQVFLLR
jgi:L-lactate dehydrogenase complex protein LldG